VIYVFTLLTQLVKCLDRQFSIWVVSASFWQLIFHKRNSFIVFLR